MWRFILLSLLLGVPSLLFAMVPCLQDEARKKERSAELQAIVGEDQKDREKWQSLTPDQMLEVAKRDVVRRKRVGEIFGEGCFSMAQDYAAAALVFQHGDAPDHFFQTFLWAKRAVDLGDEKQKELIALGADRYLVAIGKKQLFASQAFQKNAGDCFCLRSVEKKFPEKRRKELANRTYQDALKWVNSLNAGKKCRPATECSIAAEATPPGTLPGFW